MNPKNVKLRYVCLSSGNVFDEVDKNTFSGLEVKYYYKKISTIIERTPAEVLTTISFRPTLTPVVQSIKCNDGYIQERYSSNVISKEYREDPKGIIQGEHLWYNTNSVKNGRQFIYEGSDISTEVMSAIGYNPAVRKDWLDFDLGEDEMFNLMVRYGVDFQFYDEYKKDNARFEQLIQLCLSK